MSFEDVVGSTELHGLENTDKSIIIVTAKFWYLVLTGIMFFLYPVTALGGESSAEKLASSSFAVTVPSRDDIQKWWSKTSQEKLTIIGELTAIRLLNKEIAYLAPVEFYKRGRNFVWRSVLVRPVLQEVRENNDSIIGEKYFVLNLDSDGISTLETVTLGSGQGGTIGAKSIVQFDGWEPVVLYQNTFEESRHGCRVSTKEGDCMCRCFSRKEVIYNYADINFDDKKDLIETVVISSNDNKDDVLTVEKTVKVFIFSGRKFSEIKNGKR